MTGRLSLPQAFLFLLRRDLLLAFRNRAEYAVPLLFFVLVITLFPLALGALPELLARIAPGIIWVAALLASMLSLDSIFRSDFDDGSLEQILLSAHPVAMLVLEAPNMETIEVPLVAGADVGELSMFSRLGAAISYLVFGPSGS